MGKLSISSTSYPDHIQFNKNLSTRPKSSGHLNSISILHCMVVGAAGADEDQLVLYMRYLDA